MVTQALEHYPNDAPVFFDYARMAEIRRDWPEAGTRWAAVTERFPEPSGKAPPVRPVRCGKQGQTDQARALLVPILEQFPTVAGPIHEMARIEEAARDWPAAEQRWRAFIALMPDPWWGYASLANTLREQGRIPEAEAVLSEQFERLAHEPWPFVDHARLAERSADWPAALARWEDVIRRFPDLWEGYAGRAPRRASKASWPRQDRRSSTRSHAFRWPWCRCMTWPAWRSATATGLPPRLGGARTSNWNWSHGGVTLVSPSRCGSRGASPKARQFWPVNANACCTHPPS